jgi:hypothetical protein
VKGNENKPKALNQGGKTMKRFALIALASALIVPGLFAQRVKVDYNESHDFSTYRTYAWKGCKALKNGPGGFRDSAGR